MRMMRMGRKSLSSVQRRLWCRMLSKNSSLHASRISARGVSLDVNLCAMNPELVFSHLNARGEATSLRENVTKLAELRTSRNNEIAVGNDARRKRHKLSDEIGSLMTNTSTTSDDDSTTSICKCLVKQVEQLQEVIHASNAKVKSLNEAIQKNFMVIPNLLHDSVPQGTVEEDNVVVSEWGLNSRKVGNNFLWHDDIALSLGGIDSPAAVRMSGTRFSVLSGQLARLERAITNYFLDYFTCEMNYEEISVPLIVTRSTLEGTGQLPKFEDDLFQVNHTLHDEDAFLIPTGEVPLTCLQKGQLLNAEDLPLKYVCSSPCFRAEAGSRGRDTRGLLRLHQFPKVEIVKVCKVDEADEEYEKMVSDVEKLLITLDLPFRRVLLNSSDLGFSSSICYDFEVWLPGQQKFREISSVSSCGDFQSRRMGMRYRQIKKAVKLSKSKNVKVTVFPHTMNGSGLDVGRTLVAILENFQNSDGTVEIPSVLQPYMNGVTKLEPARK